MLLARQTPAQRIDIWSPRWKDRKILVAKFKVGQHNEITFSKTKSMPGSYYLSGETIRKCPIESNGKILCYIVDMNELQPLERKE